MVIPKDFEKAKYFYLFHSRISKQNIIFVVLFIVQIKRFLHSVQCK